MGGARVVDAGVNVFEVYIVKKKFLVHSRWRGSRNQRIKKNHLGRKIT